MVNRATRILIIDDSPVETKILTGILSAEGFELLTATNGSEGFTKACEIAPDMILLDVMMPGESGFDVCKRLKKNGPTSPIPVIFLSGAEDLASKVSGLTAGAVDYITKPFQRDELLARIRIHLRIREEIRVVSEISTPVPHSASGPTPIELVKPEEFAEAKFAIHSPIPGVPAEIYYDVFRMLGGAYCYFMAEASHHPLADGIASALKAVLSQHEKTRHTPIEAMLRIDGILRSIMRDENPIGACYLHLNRVTRILTFVSAGQTPILRIRPKGKSEFLAAKGGPLCDSAETALESKSVRLDAGDILLLYNRALVQPPVASHDAGDLQTDAEAIQYDRLLEIATKCRDFPLPAILNKMARVVSSHTQNENLFIFGIVV